MNKELQQRIYDQVKEHLLKQGEWCQLEGACVYRGKDGLKCAIGCLITDEHYSPGLEGMGVERPKVLEALAKSISVSVHELDAIFLERLQVIHDTAYIETWAEKLEDLAKRYRLNP